MERVRDELRPKALAAETPGEFRSVLADMLGRLGLSHFAVIPSTPDTPGDRADLSGEPGLDVRVIDKQLVVTRGRSGRRRRRCRRAPGWIVQTDRHDADVAAGLGIARWPARGWRSSRRGARACRDCAAVRLARRRHVSRRRRRGGDEDDRRRRSTGDAVTVGNLPTMYVRVSSSAMPTPAGKAAGVIGFNVWMTPVNGPFQKAMDRFRDRPTAS